MIHRELAHNSSLSSRESVRKEWDCSFPLTRFFWSRWPKFAMHWDIPLRLVLPYLAVKLRHLLGKTDEGNRRLILYMTQKMARH